MSTVMPERQIAASTDDAYGFNGAYSPSAEQLIVSSSSQWDATGMRWLDVEIPNGATIISADVSIHEYDARKSILSDVYGDDEDNCATFASLADLLARPLTTAYCAAGTPLGGWTNWGTVAFQSPPVPPRTADFVGVIQEIVNRPGWASGNALAIIWFFRQHVLGRCRSYDFAGNAHGAKLNVTYSSPASKQVMIFS